MSKTLTDNAVAQFDAVVKQAYQGSALLRSSVRLKTGVIGSTHRFPKMGKGTATVRVPQTDVIPMNIAHTKATATITDYVAPEYTDIFDQQKVNYDERSELGEVIASAQGRREDQLILDAIAAASSPLTVSTNIGGTGSDLNTAKFRRTKRLMDANGVRMGQRSFVVSATGLEALLGDSDANTFDKNVIKALFDGDIKKWLGFDIIMMEDRTEGGLPLVTALRTHYAYDRAAIGLAVGIDHRTEVNYVPVKTSWLANGLFAAGSVSIDEEGIVDISATEA